MAGTVAPNIVTDGLVLYVDVANTKSYISGSTTWNDLSQTNIGGTISGSSTYSSINSGTLIASDINFGRNTFQSNALTICAWIFRNGTGGSTMILGKGNVNDPTEWGLSFGFTNPYLIVGRTASPTNQISVPWTGSLLTGYHHVTYVTVSNTSSAMYIDGALVASTNTVGAIGLDATTSVKAERWSNFGIGAVTYGNIQLYDRALTPSEVRQNYNATKTRFGL
jgi:hypothetical protein